MSLPILAQGTHLRRGDGADPEVFTTVARVTGDIPFPQIMRDAKETTDHDSANRTKEYIAGLSDPGQVKFTINYLPGNATHKQLIADAQAGDIHNWQIVMVDDSTSTWAFSGMVLGFQAKAGTSDPYQADVTIQVSGSVTPPA